MLLRFSLYGFLKNQRYFEPFLLLALLEQGLSFSQIGLLIGFREICVNLFEIPSGALADQVGRRSAMQLSFVAYIASFAVFGLGDALWHFFVAMFFFGIGDAFRTGTHKAIIFSWLREQGCEGEKTKIYGYTRSWSKLGSALSALVAAALVFRGGQYVDIFWLSIVPYCLNIVNLATYPSSLNSVGSAHQTDHEGGAIHVVRKVLSRSLEVGSYVVKRRRLRRLMLESMGFEGVYAAVKEYLQPALLAAAISLPLWMTIETSQRSALFVGATYFVLHLLSSLASRNAHRVTPSGSEESGSRKLWWVFFAIFCMLAAAFALNLHVAVVAGFLLLAIVQNLWRPVLVSRFDDSSEPSIGATLMSLESQAKSLATMILAPLLGLAIDWASEDRAGGGLWPIGALGITVGLVALISMPKSRSAAPIAD